MKKIIAIIPARMASTRFPGKPLADIGGLSMIEHVRRRVQLCKVIEKVAVATCDKEIYNEVTRFNGLAIMTSDKHERCTDRIEEAARSLQADVVVNVQGDEPLIRPEMLESLVQPFIDDNEIICTNLVSEIISDIDFNSPNVVKTVVDLKGNVLYFSREPIPSIKKASGLKYTRLKQLGIVAFTKKFLHEFSKLTPTPHEIVESVDMMRAVEHGYKIKSVLTEFQSIGVDTPEDLRNAEELMKKDDLFNYLYKK